MKLISWNVNGIRAVMKKGFTDVLDELDADFVCIRIITHISTSTVQSEKAIVGL